MAKRYISDGSSLHQIKKRYFSDGSSWHQIKKSYVSDGSAWHLFFENFHAVGNGYSTNGAPFGKAKGYSVWDEDGTLQMEVYNIYTTEDGVSVTASLVFDSSIPLSGSTETTILSVTPRALYENESISESYTTVQGYDDSGNILFQNNSYIPNYNTQYNFKNINARTNIKSIMFSLYSYSIYTPNSNSPYASHSFEMNPGDIIVGDIDQHIINKITVNNS